MVFIKIWFMAFGMHSSTLFSAQRARNFSPELSEAAATITKLPYFALRDASLIRIIFMLSVILV